MIPLLIQVFNNLCYTIHQIFEPPFKQVASRKLSLFPLIILLGQAVCTLCQNVYSGTQLLGSIIQVTCYFFLNRHLLLDSHQVYLCRYVFKQMQGNMWDHLLLL